MASRSHLGKLGGGRLRTDYSSSFDFIVTDHNLHSYHYWLSWNQSHGRSRQSQVFICMPTKLWCGMQGAASCECRMSEPMQGAVRKATKLIIEGDIL